MLITLAGLLRITIFEVFKQTKTQKMRSQKQIECTRVETKEGVIFFQIVEIYNDGILWKTQYERQDNREYKTAGECYYNYKTEKGYRNAINRAQLIK